MKRASLVSALQIAAAQRTRAAQKFTPGTAARVELDTEAMELEQAARSIAGGAALENVIDTPQATPLEQAARKR